MGNAQRRILIASDRIIAFRIVEFLRIPAPTVLTVSEAKDTPRQTFAH
jgi:hypothetical protein